MEQDDGDMSQLVPPIAISVNGVLKILAAYRTGTSEVQQLLGSECNVILECKQCQSLYRSVANFISHKRNYCRKNQIGVFPLQVSRNPETYTNIETINTSLQRRDLSHIVDCLSVKASNVANDGVVCDTGTSQRVQYFTAVAEAVKERRAAKIEHSMLLAPLASTSKAVAHVYTTQKTSPIQLTTDSQNQQQTTNEGTVEGHVSGEKKKRGRPKKISLEQTHLKSNSILSTSTSSSSSSSPSGQPTPTEKAAPNYCCEKCHAQFTSQKSLNLHETTQHMTTRMQYKCPCCKSCFCNLWSTYRHLKTVHNKSQEQVERMKPVIRKRAFKMTVPLYIPATSSVTPPATPSSTPTSSPSITAKTKPKITLGKTQQEMDKAWVGSDNNFTVDVGDHRCGVCGLRFERRAALVSHTNTCHRRPTSTNTSARSATTSKSPGRASPSIEVSPTIVEKTKPEGAANRKSSAPMKIIRDVQYLFPTVNNNNVENKSPRKVTTPMKITMPTKEKSPEKIASPPKVTSPTKIASPPKVTSPTKIASPPKEMSPTKITSPPKNTETKSNKMSPTKSPPKVSVNVPKILQKPSKNIKEDSAKNQASNKIIENGFTEPNSTLPTSSVNSDASSVNKVPFKLPTSMNPVVKIYSNKNLMNKYAPKKSSPPNIIKKSTTKVFKSTAAALLEEARKNVKETLFSKIRPEVTIKLVDKHDKQGITSSLSQKMKEKVMKNDGNVPTFIKLTPVSMAPSTNGTGKMVNVKTIVPFTLQKSGVQKFVPIPEKILTTPPKAALKLDAPPQQRAEIIVRTVSEKPMITYSKAVNGTAGHGEQQPTSNSLITCLPGATDNDKTAKSSIQVRRDYSKVLLGDLEQRSEDLEVDSEEEDFGGWDANNVDDYQGQLGLPQINNMNLVYRLISDSDTPFLESSDSEYPRSPSTKFTTSSDESFDVSPVKNSDMNDSDSNPAKRRKIE